MHPCISTAVVSSLSTDFAVAAIVEIARSLPDVQNSQFTPF